ncbi:MAG: hypothetical protein EA368_17290 [Leptolyngbya sp. DLM2.Bin27]|nr:MAG: hypothetical protein EA368_17290 [Leptolyngbya sp. DLM2.Bin27]
MGDGPLASRPDSLIAGRFLVWREGQRATPQGYRLWLDTRPDTPLPALEHIPPQVLTYLKLFYLAQHVPRPYAYLTPEQTGLSTPVLLLDGAPIGTDLIHQTASFPGDVEAMLLPPIAKAWANGSAMQQLNWLRQIAALWPALAEHQVASTLLNLEDLRVDGALLRLTTLAIDQTCPPLSALGNRWRELVNTAQPTVQPYLQWLVKALSQGLITAAAHLNQELEGAIQTLAQGLLVTIDWAADTDQGPTRDRNEDACYPEQISRQQRLVGSAIEVDAPPLLLVCDGIGGHEQGSVASQTAIKLLRQELEPLVQQPQLPPAAVAQRLKQAIILANDAISARNNDEHRSARARMGTTVVLALVHFPYVAIAHIGDSRAYRISAHTCYQITVDDDVASREAQLGYALYSEAVQLPSGGALIQALGISESDFLYPSVQHLLLDDPAILLLCSDGLSDYDRVEALAPHLVAPLVTASGPLGARVTELMQQANRLNGHDNVTVGLMRFTPQSVPLAALPADSLLITGAAPAAAPAGSPGLTLPPQPPPPTQLVAPVTAAASSPPRSSFAWLPFLGGMAVVLAILGTVGWVVNRRQPLPIAFQPLAVDLPLTAAAGQALHGAALAATADIPVGSFWQADNGASLGIAGGPLRLQSQPQSIPDPLDTAAVATGSILRVVSRQTTADNTSWVRLQICSIPSGTSLDQLPQESDQMPPAGAIVPDLNQQILAPGDDGWADIRQLYTAAAFLGLVPPAQAGLCAS